MIKALLIAIIAASSLQAIADSGDREIGPCESMQNIFEMTVHKHCLKHSPVTCERNFAQSIILENSMSRYCKVVGRASRVRITDR